MQPRLPVKVLPRESQVDRRLRPGTAWVFIRQHRPEGIALSFPHHLAALVPRRGRRVEMVGFRHGPRTLAGAKHPPLESWNSN